MPKHVKCKMSELLLVCLCIFFLKVKKQADLEKDEGTRVFFFLKVEKQADLFFFLEATKHNEA